MITRSCEAAHFLAQHDLLRKRFHAPAADDAVLAADTPATTSTPRSGSSYLAEHLPDRAGDELYVAAARPVRPLLSDQLKLTNINNDRGVSTLGVAVAPGGYQAFPLAPRMAFVTLAAKF